MGRHGTKTKNMGGVHVLIRMNGWYPYRVEVLHQVMVHPHND